MEAEAGERGDDVERKVTTLIKFLLAQLFYPVDWGSLERRGDARLTATVRMLERAAGLTPDGILTVGELSAAQRAVDDFNATPIFPSAFRFFATDNRISAEGTWVGQRINYPINKNPG